MTCKLCGSEQTALDYCGQIRLGMAAGYTTEDVELFRCEQCGVLWHNYQVPAGYYESEAYRIAIEGDSDPEQYFVRHDAEVMPKLKWTGTDIFRHKTVADVGCGGGSFLDFVKGVAKQTIGIEPSAVYRQALAQRGHLVYPYASEAAAELAQQVDVVTSFDVVEHVDAPQAFVNGMFDLMKPGGKCIIGTPTDYPVLRKLVGAPFERFIFNANHPWVFTEDSLKYILEKAGFKQIEIKQTYRFGIGNVLAWMGEQQPRGNLQYDFLSKTIDKVWKTEMIDSGMGEYLVAYATK